MCNVEQTLELFSSFQLSTFNATMPQEGGINRQLSEQRRD